MIPEPIVTVRPLSPRFAALEKSLSQNNEHSNGSTKYDGELKKSPRILTKLGKPALNKRNNNERSIPKFGLGRFSPLPFLNDFLTDSEDEEEFDKRYYPGGNMSLSLEKTLDSESLSITTKPLWDELIEAGYGYEDHKEYTDAADHSSATITDRRSDAAGKEDVGVEKVVKTHENNQHKQLVKTSRSRPQPAPTKDAGGSANVLENILGESQNALTSARSQNQRSSSRKEVTNPRAKDVNKLTLTDTAVNDLKQAPVSSNMERKLLANLPKKLREEAVLRTFAANLKQASSSAKPSLPKRQNLEGRSSADSGRESVYDDETRPRLYRFDSSSSVSSVGSTRSGLRGNGNGTIKPWSVVMMAETIKKRRQDAVSKGNKAKVELETLKEKLEQSQAKANGLEAEVGPLREKLKRYEDIIENLEDKVEGSRQEMLVKDRDSLAQVNKLEREKSNVQEEERMKREETESELKNKLRHCESEVNFYKKQVNELEDSLALLKEKEDAEEENNPFAKQMSSLRKELVQVREVLSSSEKERLNERKEKLSALQNMIKLTKLKSDIEEELDERKKADTKETGDKYIQLSGKLAVSEMKLQKLRKEMATEVERLQKKHIKEINSSETSHEKAKTQLRKEIDALRRQLKDLEDQHRPSSPGRVVPYHGRWSAMRSESRKHTTEMKDIITQLEADGLGPDQCSSEEVVRVLFTRQKELSKKLKEAEDVLTSCKNGDPRPVIQELKDERKTLKRTIEDLRQSVSATESQLKLTEMTSKRQTEDLIDERKSLFLQLQKASDDYDIAKGNVEQLQKDLVDTKSMLSKRQNELELLRENLLSVTNEMKTVDADLGKTRKDLSLKSAELERLKRDIVLETERVQQERKNNSRLTSELENKKKIIKDSDKLITDLEAKIQRLTENLEASQMHVNRAVSERDSLKTEVQSLRMAQLSNEAELNQSNSVLGNLKNQVRSLEHALQERVDQLAAATNELDKAKADSLGANHLLGIEEDRNKELEDEIDELTFQLTKKSGDVGGLNDRIKSLEEELDDSMRRFNSIQLDYAETETSLKSHESAKVSLGKELNTLQLEYREISREKQRLTDILKETKNQLEEKSNRLSKLDSEFKDYKHSLKEKIRIIKEITIERDGLQEKLTYEKTQNQLFSSNMETSSTEVRKYVKEIEDLNAAIKEVTQSKEHLSEELDRMGQEYKMESEKQQEQIKNLRKENTELVLDVKAAKEKASQFEDESRRVKAELKDVAKTMSNENLSLTSEVARVREDFNREIESERKKHKEELRQINSNHELQKKNVEKLSLKIKDAEGKNLQMEQLMNEKESQLRMLSREKEKLEDTVKFLEGELKNADENLLEKEKELNGMKTEKEREISSLKVKQGIILDDLQEANDRLMERENEQVQNASEMDEVVKALKLENQDLKSVKSNMELHVQQLENEMKRKETENRALCKNREQEINSLEENASRMEEMARNQEGLLDQVKKELEEKRKENAKLNRKVKELIEESERVGEQACQVAQVEQVESAAMGYDFMIADEQVSALEKEKGEIKKKLDETIGEMERSRKASQLKRKLYQETEVKNKALIKELEHERKEKVEALRCLKALIVDNESMAKCVVGLQETITLQREENSDTRRHLKEVLDRYELQREISLKTQKTYESVIHTEFARHRQDNGSMNDSLSSLRDDLDHVKAERDKIALQFENKDKELERTRSEIGSLRSLLETKVINFEVEKRARELLESKLQQFANENSFAQKRLNSMENSQKDLFGKYVNLQKWHNNVEVNLINGITQSPLSIKELYEDQARRENFLKAQSNALNERYKTLGIMSDIGMDRSHHASQERR